MKRTLLAALLLALAVPVMATGIPKWRTPDGTLHFGDNPPAGSIFVERIDEFDRGADPSAEEEKEKDHLREARERAAADGRAIMRRRAAEREAARKREATVEPRRDVVVDRDVVVVTPGVHFRPLKRFHPPVGFDRPQRKPERFDRVEQPRRAPVQDAHPRRKPGQLRERNLSIGPRPLSALSHR